MFSTNSLPTSAFRCNGPIPMSASARQAAGACGLARMTDWAGMSLPLVACAAIWGLGAPAADALWLPVLHKVIAIAASVWTALRMILRRRRPLSARSPMPASVGASLAVLYVLLALQPLLAVAGTLLHGNKIRLFGFALPSILPTDQALAVLVDRVHGWNAVLLLTLMVSQAALAFRNVVDQGAR